MAKRMSIKRMIRRHRRLGGGIRQTTLRVLGGKLDKHGATYKKVHLEHDHDEDGPTVEEIVEDGLCGFGHTIGEKGRVVGVCEIGEEVVCSMEGCALQCVRCGAVVCRKHSRTYGEKTYCRRCRWVYYWRLFWRLD